MINPSNINLNDFLNKLANGSGEVEIKNIFLSVELHLDSSHFDNKAVTFINCHFYKPLTFSNIDFNYGIQFIDCKFFSALAFSQTKTSYFNNNWNSDGDAVIISSCIIKDFRIHSGCSFYGSIKIINNSIINKLIITDLKLTHQNAIISTKNSQFTDAFCIHNIESKNSISISKTKIECDLELSKNKSRDLTIKNSTIDGLTQINDNFFSHKLLLYSTTFASQCILTSVETKKLELHGCSFNDGFSFSFRGLEHLKGFKIVKISSCNFANGAEFIGNYRSEAPSFIDEIKITTSTLLRGFVRFFNFKSKEINLTGSNYDSHIVFENVSTNNLRIKALSNYCKLQFTNLSSIEQFNSNLSIHDSSLGNTYFVNCDLSCFNEISIKDSMLSEINVTNVDWFTTNQLKFDPQVLNQPKQKRELYRQLKLAMENQGDRIQALSFKRHEMSSYLDETISKKGNYGDKAILILSLSNEFGLNWWMPLIFLVYLTFIFSILILLAFSLQGHSVLFILCEFKSIFFILLNPTHSLNSFFGDNVYISGYMYFVDIVYRIIYAYLVFQIVSAFRKFIK